MSTHPTDRIAVTDLGVLMMAADELEKYATELKRAHTLFGGSDWGNDPDDQVAQMQHEHVCWLVERLKHLSGLTRPATTKGAT